MGLFRCDCPAPTSLNIDKSLNLLYTSIGEERHAHRKGKVMRVIHCEQCGTPLPWTAQFCAVCGTAVSLHPLISDYPDAAGQYAKRPRTGSLKTYSFYKMGQSDPDETQRINHTQVRANNTQLPTVPAFDVAASSHAFVEDWSEEEAIEGEISRRDTWQKFVTHKTPAISVGTMDAVVPVTPPNKIWELREGPATPIEPVLSPPPSYRVRAGLAPALVSPPRLIRSSLRAPRLCRAWQAGLP